MTSRPFALCFLFLAAAAAHAAPPTHWVGSWAASQQIPEPANAIPAASLHDTTLRQVVHLSIGGPSLRIHLSNAFGASALRITSVSIASPDPALPGAILPATLHPVLFHTLPAVTIPPAADFLSDPISFPALPFADLAITLHFDTLPPQQTGHPGSRATSFLAPGDLVSAPVLPATTTTLEHWYILSGVDVLAPATAHSIVTLGDSITDGHGAGTNKNERWPDVLARRLPPTIAVLNQGIGGNHLLTDGLGPNVLARFDRDVLAQPGVAVVILLEAINDLGGLSREGPSPAAAHEDLVQRLIASYEQVIARAHAQNIRVLGATVTPYLGSDYYHPAPENEDDRQRLNTWIRTPGHFDAVLDFDRVIADPAHPGHILPAYDGGDHLHPSPAGYKALADSIPLNLLH